MKHSTITTKGIGCRSREFAVGLFLPGLLALLGIFSTPVIAQESLPGAIPVNVVSLDHNKLLEDRYDENGVFVGYTVKSIPDWPTVPQWVNSILNDPELTKNWEKVNKAYNMLQFLNMFKRNPCFTSDGKYILFDDRTSAAWMVPVEGGEPQLAFDWYLKVTYNQDGQIVGGCEGITQTFGLSPDGSKVAACLSVIDLDDGTIRVEGPNGSSYFSNKVNNIVMGDIKTGEEQRLAHDAIFGKWSHDGRFFVYVQRDHQNVAPIEGWDNFFSWEQMITGVFVKNLSTGQEWKVASEAAYPCFSADDSSILCSMRDTNGNWQIFSIPREGGTPRQITFYGPNDDGRNARLSDVSPDGQWILYSGEFTAGFDTRVGLCVCNMVTGESYPLFPEATCITTDGSFSPDGKKIVFSANYPYISKDGKHYVDGYQLYIMDFNSNAYGKPTAVADAVPSGFALSGNYPNPFNPSTSINFTLPVSGNTQLAVYDITGRKVRDLVNGPTTAGEHSVTWDGHDSSGRPVSSGVYLSRLTWNGHSVSHRMLLAK